MLGRVSNLPTVWSNCLAGWWLGGAGSANAFPLLLLGISGLYVGGMFLNDAFDVEFDRQYRQERPIPSGRISVEAVWRWGIAWLSLGGLSLICLNQTAGILGLVLMALILVYDAFHKRLGPAPWLLGLCRLCVYLIAATVGQSGIGGTALWCGLALAAYVIGLSYLARRESAPGVLRYWPLILLATPILLALLLNGTGYRKSALLLSGIFALSVVKALRFTLWSASPNIGKTVSLLLAGIVFVDWLAAADAPRDFGLAFLGLFAAALVLQRTVPAT